MGTIRLKKTMQRMASNAQHHQQTGGALQIIHNGQQSYYGGRFINDTTTKAQHRNPSSGMEGYAKETALLLLFAAVFADISLGFDSITVIYWDTR